MVTNRVRRICKYVGVSGLCLVVVLAFSVMAQLTFSFGGLEGSFARKPLPTSGYVVLKCDFHVHSNVSDGSYRPSYVVDLFKSRGYDCIALTDHNNITGWSEAIARGNEVDLLVIQGQEISTRFSSASGATNVQHMLGLFLTSDVAEGSSIYDTLKYPHGTVEAWFRDIDQQGGIGVVCHPWDTTLWDQYATSYFNDYVIDAWEWRPKTATTVIKFYSNVSMTMLLDRQMCLFNSDFHKTTALNVNRYTLVIAHNRTLEGVKDALQHERTVIAYDGYYYGMPENLALLIQLHERFAVKFP